MAGDEVVHAIEEGKRTGFSSENNNNNNNNNNLHHHHHQHHHKTNNAISLGGSTPEAPRSINSITPGNKNFRLPLKMPDIQKKQIPPPKLIHPFLNNVPMHVRFGINGFLSNVLFMVTYNTSVTNFEHVVAPSTIYSIVYAIFIPIGHALVSLLVFGWPEKYFTSLISNLPIGLTAMALGAALTAYLDEANFNSQAEELVSQTWSNILLASSSSTIDGGVLAEIANESSSSSTTTVTTGPHDENGEFYSSLVVLFVTGIWSFALSVIVNAPNETSEKKEL